MLDAGAGFTNYLWSTGDASPMIIATTTNSYAVAVTDTNGCVTPSNVVSVIVNVPATPLITEDNNLLSASTSIGYQWYRDGVEIPGETFQTIEPDSDGAYVVETTDDNGCVASSDHHDVLPSQRFATATGAIEERDPL